MVVGLNAQHFLQAERMRSEKGNVGREGQQHIVTRATMRQDQAQ